MQKCLVCNRDLVVLFNTSFYCQHCENSSKEVKFEDLSFNEQRIAIAKDVLGRIEAKKIIPMRGNFINPLNDFMVDESQEPECMACAIGSILLCCVSRNKSSVKNFLMYSGSIALNRENIHKALESYFSSDQLNLIEAAFEHTNAYSTDPNVSDLYKASKFRKDAELDSQYNEKVLIRIMTNIIDNDGVFVP